ncbi:MAG: alkyl sulfatase dimerization domain-containing protein [Solirubrobacterales bacterium]|nr:alkyl sulfatase dimerization domain-containing protein [Solirubrobacterales bacterium]
MDLLELADRLWSGDLDVAGPPSPEHPGDQEAVNPFVPRGELVEVGQGTAFVSSFANVSAFETTEGLVCVDSGAPFSAAEIHRMIRAWSPARLHTTIFSHGHIDHVLGTGPFEAEARERGWAPPRVVAHENVAARFDRYKLTAGYNSAINSRQFGVPVDWPTDYRYPDETYRERVELEVGGERFELHHAKGETDDHSWTWVPARGVVCPGDLIIWCVPNAGNPQKVQRYPREWAAALREMSALGAETLLPGHGLPVVGADRVRAILDDTAALLEHLHDETVRMMNEDASLNQIVHEVQPPAELLGKPYLRPIYDDPEFVVRNVWRLYGGWYDLDPAGLKPARSSDLAREIASLAGGASELARRARQLASEGEFRLAGHLAEFAIAAAPGDSEVRVARAEVYERRSAAEPSLMAKSIFAAAARDPR